MLLSSWIIRLRCVVSLELGDRRWTTDLVMGWVRRNDSIELRMRQVLISWLSLHHTTNSAQSRSHRTNTMLWVLLISIHHLIHDSRYIFEVCASSNCKFRLDLNKRRNHGASWLAIYLHLVTGAYRRVDKVHDTLFVIKLTHRRLHTACSRNGARIWLLCQVWHREICTNPLVLKLESKVWCYLSLMFLCSGRGHGCGTIREEWVIGYYVRLLSGHEWPRLILLK